jgi:MFS family permease
LTGVNLGLRANWRQFTLLVIVNAFVGAMVGLERAVLPVLAESEFGIASRTAMLSFIASFGLAKAFANLAAGRLSDRSGRKPVLVVGWLFALPVPLLIIWAPGWEWVVVANVLLGINQGLAWSSTVIMKIDLVGPRRRGLAMGINESAGYLAVSATAMATGYIAAAYDLRPEPFYLGFLIALAGLVLSLLFVRESHHHAHLESRQHEEQEAPSFGQVVLATGWRNKRLLGVCQSGLVNNLNDGLAWGLFPVYFATLGYSIERIAVLAAIYPAVWGFGQLATGYLSDLLGRKPLIVGGMLVQALGIFGLLMGTSFDLFAGAMVILGIGTAMVYPTLLALIGDEVHPSWRASSVGVYRLWRDGGYVVGAVMAGVLADLFGMDWAIAGVGLLTAFSGGLSAILLRKDADDEDSGERFSSTP